jgi:hypothetical protein
MENYCGACGGPPRRKPSVVNRIRVCVSQLTLSGHFTSLRRLFAKIEVNWCNGDVTPTECQAMIHRKLIASSFATTSTTIAPSKQQDAISNGVVQGFRS